MGDQDHKITPDTAELQRRVAVLSGLLHLEQQLRNAQTLRELSFLVVNETLGLLAFRQAVFWEQISGGRIRITSVSGVEQVDANAPYPRFLQQLIKGMHTASSSEAQIFTIHSFNEKIRQAWSEWAPGELLSVNLKGRDGGGAAGLVFMRQAPWTPAETALAQRVADTFSHAGAALVSRTSLFQRMGVKIPGRLGAAAGLCFIFLLFLPVRLSVLAPMEIIPRNPEVVASPMSGAVKAVAVSPNQMVKTGQLLFTLDDIRIRNEYDIALKTLSVLKADHLRALQKAFADQESRARILMIEAEMEQQQATIDYLSEELERSRVLASADGIAVFTDVNDWIGRPVVVGEKIMTIADPAQVAAQIQLPVNDAVNLNPGATIRLFLNTSPDHPMGAVLEQAAYEAQVTEAGILAFRLKARLDQGVTPPRIGLRGTAKIYGEKVTLLYYLLRRPLSGTRRYLGM